MRFVYDLHLYIYHARASLQVWMAFWSCHSPTNAGTQDAYAQDRAGKLAVPVAGDSHITSFGLRKLVAFETALSRRESVSNSRSRSYLSQEELRTTMDATSESRCANHRIPSRRPIRYRLPGKALRRYCNFVYRVVHSNPLEDGHKNRDC